ncbi:MAG: protein kinase [Chloroflexi bacterium]|nr:protein kinase [Chloroflexota bacterium]
MSEDLIGKAVNGYEILRQVGYGGMATVYLARQQSMNRNVALKFLPSNFIQDDMYLQRFEREVKIVAQLEHRNIVPVYDYGEHEGQPYIVMRYMSSGSVEDLLAKGKISIDRVLAIAEQIASALDYAHHNGILHRDLKPSNILLDDGGGAFITDFGIARILGERSSTLTTQGVVGTPSYMSPEQARGEGLDGRSNIYSLGVMLFEMICGRRPFESDTPYGIVVMHVTAPPPSLRDFETSISAAVDKVILRALSKQPDQRPPTASALAAALRKAVDHPGHATDTEPSMPPIEKPASSPGLEPDLAPQLPASLANGLTEAAEAPPLQRAAFAEGARPRRGPAGMLKGMLAGGAVGCALLGLLLGLGLLLLVAMSGGLGSIAEEAPAPPPVRVITAAEVQPTADSPPATVAFDLALDPAGGTRQAWNAAAAATIEADSLARAQLAPTSAGLGQPIGSTNRLRLNAALDGVTGKLVYFGERPADDADETSFEILAKDLETWQDTFLTLDIADSTYPQPSPDGRWIAFQSDRDGDFEIFVTNVLGGQLRQITRNAVWDRLPAWSPDSQWIVYSSDVRGDQSFDLYRVRPDGSDAQLVYSDGHRNSHARFSPDGDSLVFTSGPGVRDATTWEIRLLNLRSNESTLLTENNNRDASPTFSPDGKRILYVSAVGGSRVVASMTVDGRERELLYTGPGTAWSANYSPDGKFIVVTATYDGEDQLFLMTADGGNLQQITNSGGAFASWIPPLQR